MPIRERTSPRGPRRASRGRRDQPLDREVPDRSFRHPIHSCTSGRPVHRPVRPSMPRAITSAPRSAPRSHRGRASPPSLPRLQTWSPIFGAPRYLRPGRPGHPFASARRRGRARGADRFRATAEPGPLRSPRSGTEHGGPRQDGGRVVHHPGIRPLAPRPCARTAPSLAIVDRSFGRALASPNPTPDSTSRAFAANTPTAHAASLDASLRSTPRPRRCPARCRWHLPVVATYR